MNMDNFKPSLINRILNTLTYIAVGVFVIWIWADRELKIAVGYLVICGVAIWVLSFLTELLIKSIDKKKGLEAWQLTYGLPNHWLIIFFFAGIVQFGLVIMIALYLLRDYL